MKFLLTIALLTSIISMSAFAEGESSTDCPWSDQSSRSSTPNKNSEAKVKRPKQTQGSKAVKM